MKKRNFHSMQATILESGFNEIFISYQTPVIVRVDGLWYELDKYFSQTTSRQKNRYKRENGIETKLVEHSEFNAQYFKALTNMQGANA